MKVTKKFGFTYVMFEGTPKAIDTFTRIHSEFSRRGYGLVLPNKGEVDRVVLAGKGYVHIQREDDDYCVVTEVHGPFVSFVLGLFGRL